MPSHFSLSRLVLFSKSGTPETNLDQIRPISIGSHLTRILEKAIKNKIDSLDSELL